MADGNEIWDCYEPIRPGERVWFERHYVVGGVEGIDRGEGTLSAALDLDGVLAWKVAVDPEGCPIHLLPGVGDRMGRLE